jgi:hypothetical protein
VVGCNSTTVMWPTARSWTVFKRTLPQSSRSDVTYVVPVVVNCSYCTPDDGYGTYPKHVEWSCNKIKILVLHLVGHFLCIYIENDARNHEPKIHEPGILFLTKFSRNAKYRREVIKLESNFRYFCGFTKRTKVTLCSGCCRVGIRN